jgi:hypothetical protein
MNKHQMNNKDKKYSAISKGCDNNRKKWKAPQILWSESLQTLAYQCNGGLAPGSSGVNCPP